MMAAYDHGSLLLTGSACGWAWDRLADAHPWQCLVCVTAAQNFDKGGVGKFLWEDIPLEKGDCGPMDCSSIQ